MAAIRGSHVPFEIYVADTDLTGVAVTVAVVFARRAGLTPTLTKTRTAGDITVTYDAGTGKSLLAFTLADTETATWTGEIAYTVYIDDGVIDGEWIPDSGGVGTIQFTDSVKRS